MKKLHKAEIIVLTLTILCLTFTIGFFVGRSTSKGIITIESSSASNSDAPQSSTMVPSIVTTASPSSPAETTPNETVQPPKTERPSDAPATASPASPAPQSVSPSADMAVTNKNKNININTASSSELDSLPGIGPVIAGNIIAYRTAHGPFKTTEELMDVDGIGQKKYDAIKYQITIN